MFCTRAGVVGAEPSGAGRFQPATETRRPSASQCHLRVITPATHGSSARARPQMKILVVEDDLDQLDIASHKLRRERFVVIEASDGAQALRRFKTERPDLVVVNLALPQPDGL